MIIKKEEAKLCREHSDSSAVQGSIIIIIRGINRKPFFIIMKIIRGLLIMVGV